MDRSAPQQKTQQLAVAGQGAEPAAQARTGTAPPSAAPPTPPAPRATLTVSTHPGTRPPQQQCALITGLCNTPWVNEMSYFINI